MDPMLKEATQTGDIDALYDLIREDAYILERIAEVPFIDTPLHISAFEGHIEFAMEIMNLKPSFSRKLNQDGFSPTHLALRYYQDRIVLWLLDIDGGLVRVKGRGGMTPLHYAVKQGNLLILTEFFKNNYTMKPLYYNKPIEYQHVATYNETVVLQQANRIIDVTNQGETAFHIAVKNNRIEAFKVLIGWLKRIVFKDAAFWEREILDWKNKEGNTVLHIAALMGQHEVAKLLIKNFVHPDIKNSDGVTAMDILQEGQIPHRGSWSFKIRRAIHHGVIRRTTACSVKDLQEMSTDNPITISLTRSSRNVSRGKRNAELVVYVLIATITYQGALRPPGGVWRGTAEASASHNLVGTSVMSDIKFGHFWYANTILFVLSIGRISVITVPGSHSDLLFPIQPSMVLLFSCYTLAMSVISPTKDWSSLNFFLFNTCNQAFIQILGFFMLSTLMKHKQAWRRSRQPLDERKEWW